MPSFVDCIAYIFSLDYWCFIAEGGHMSKCSDILGLSARAECTGSWRPRYMLMQRAPLADEMGGTGAGVAGHEVHHRPLQT